MTTKANLLSGLAEYIDRELVTKIDDRPLRILIATAAATIKRNPDAADPIIAHPIIAAILAGDGAGNYDFRAFTQSLKDSIDRHGSLAINIPPVPMLSPRGITITLDADDVGKLESYIQEV